MHPAAIWSKLYAMDRQARREYNAEYYRNHRAEILANRIAYRKEHREEILSYLTRWRQSHPDYMKEWSRSHPEYSKEWDASHPQQRREITARCYRKHREERLKYHRDYARSHRKEQAAWQALWRKRHPNRAAALGKQKRDRNPELYRAIAVLTQSRRRARERSLPATLTLAEWEAIEAAYGHRCAYCGKKRKALTQDHIIPVSKGGGTTMTNIIPSCITCNKRKGASLKPAQPVMV